ncbi:lysozyme inhibitor LprI family protein, partial [Helicobacter typhlonius]
MRVWYIFVFVWILPLGVNAKDEPRKHPLAVFANCDEVCFDNALNDDLTLKDDIEPIKAPSFDCTKAHNAIEQMICKDKELAMLDALMAQRYKYVKDYIPTLVESNSQLQAIGQKELKNMLLSMQRDWLKTLQSCQNLPSNKARLCVRELLALRVLSLAIFPYDRFYPDTLGELDDFNNMGISYFNNAWDFMTYLSLNYGCHNALSVLITNQTEANKPLVYYTWE